MPEISLSNNKARDAAVMGESVRMQAMVRWLDPEDRQATSARILKSTIGYDYETLLKKAGCPEGVAQALIDGDPEIDLESACTFMRDSKRVYINSDRQVVYAVTEIEVVRNPDGSERLRREKKITLPNVNVEHHPLLWSGKFLTKREVAAKFVIASKLQVMHVNGLTYDFLLGIARELEQKNSLLVVGAGPKASQPLILRRGSLPYRGFLEGRTRGDEYCLLLHLSNLELKAPAPAGEGKPS
jgi:hypothetical protein